MIEKVDPRKPGRTKARPPPGMPKLAASPPGAPAPACTSGGRAVRVGGLHELLDAARDEKPAVGERDGGGVPAADVHRPAPRPRVRARVEDARVLQALELGDAVVRVARLEARIVVVAGPAHR